MGLLKDAVGAVVSTAVIGGLFLGPGVFGLLFGLVADDMVDVLVAPRRDALDAAFIASPVYIPGELDGPDAPDGDRDEVPDEEPAEADAPAEPGPADAPPAEPASPPADPGAAVVATPVAKRGPGAATHRGRDPNAAKPVQGAAPKPRQARAKKTCEPSYRGISRRSDGTYEIARSLVNYHTASVKQFNELGWSKPNEKGDGKGWYVSGFGCNDPLWHGGLRRGDVVLTVNGKKTNNMLQILMLYTKVKAQRRFEVKILRKGKPITLNYEVVQG